jgi:hypothetical protein
MLIREPKKEWRLLEWFIPAATFAMALLNWAWWLDGEPYRPLLALFMVFGLTAFAFELGFKSFKLQQKRSAYFMLVFIAPLVMGVLGAVGGFFYSHGV